MATAKSDIAPYWSTSTTFPQFAKLADNTEADVVIIGGGITGPTAAYLLAKAGKRVVVLERGRCASTDTGHTSAHLTMVTDMRLSDLVKGFGRGHAQAVWDAGLAAIAKVDDASDAAEDLKADATLASELGFDAEYLESVPLVSRPVSTERVWEGLFAITADSLPYIGPHRRYPHHWFALGYGGNGMTFGFLAARLLLERWQGLESRDHALFEFARLRNKR